MTLQTVDVRLHYWFRPAMPRLVAVGLGMLFKIARAFGAQVSFNLCG